MPVIFSYSKAQSQNGKEKEKNKHPKYHLEHFVKRDGKLTFPIVPIGNASVMINI